VLYLDFDNFKPFADFFGFSVADRVIREFGVALGQAAGAAPGALPLATGPVDHFVGHIGGDDFLVIAAAHEAETLARDAARRLREIIGRAVGEEALALGAFSGPGRDGQVRLFPLARLSTAVLLVRPERWVSTSHLGTLAADVKRRAKARGAGTILVEEV
jgi:GGDEF domain-containing protein